MAAAPSWSSSPNAAAVPAPSAVPPPPGTQHAPPYYVPPGRYGPQNQGTNGLAVASLVLSLAFVCGIGSVLAVIFGYTARRQIRENGGQGDGLALAGLIIGWIGVGLVALYIVAVIVIALAGASGTTG